jgi:hypothetical protein
MTNGSHRNRQASGLASGYPADTESSHCSNICLAAVRDHALTVAGGKIVAIDSLSDPARLRELHLSAFRD